MKLRPSNLKRFTSRRGSAILIVLVLLAVMGALLVANNAILHALKEELKLVDQRQQKKFAPPPARQPANAAETKTPPQ